MTKSTALWYGGEVEFNFMRHSERKTENTMDNGISEFEIFTVKDMEQLVMIGDGAEDLTRAEQILSGSITDPEPDSAMGRTSIVYDIITRHVPLYAVGDDLTEIRLADSNVGDDEGYAKYVAVRKILLDRSLSAEERARKLMGGVRIKLKES